MQDIDEGQRELELYLGLQDQRQFTWEQELDGEDGSFDFQMAKLDKHIRKYTLGFHLNYN